MLSDTYAPLKRVKKYKLKFKSKPWITLGLQKSISVKNKLLSNFTNKKDPILKDKYHTNYKIYRNLLSTLMKKTKQAYYDRFFENNWKNIKNIWRGAKSLISLKTVASSIPTVRISDSNESDSTIFLQPIDKEEIANIISRLNSSKASGPNTIPYRILFLLKNEISKQLADLFNLSFMTGVFLSVLKAAKIVPVFEKDSKLDYSPISLLSIKY